jgi:hypothetical protein
MAVLYQAEAAAYCRSNGLTPISLDDPAKEREFSSKFPDLLVRSFAAL